MLQTRTCGLCGRRIRGPAFWRHSDACRKKHGQAPGKKWREGARRSARKFEGLLRALSRTPEQHLQDIFGPGPISPQDVIDALAATTSRKSLNWVMGCCSAWRREVEGDGKLWPPDQRKALWAVVWEAYSFLHKTLPGRRHLLRRTL